jgi:soluble lytic murein transglycosylase-like protein
LRERAVVAAPNGGGSDVFATKKNLIGAVVLGTLATVGATQAAGAPSHPNRHAHPAQAEVRNRMVAATEHNKAQARRARHRNAATPATGSATAASGGGASSPESYGVSQSTLDAIAACESGGDPSAVSAGGTYRGLYQFDQATWESVGGTGDPAAASPAEQSMRAAILYSRSGSSPWPVCGQ